jgi:hypothetical protein
VSDRRVARHALGERHAVNRLTAREEALRALVCEIQTGPHLDDGLAEDAEAEMTGLNDAGMDGTDGNLIDALALHFRERKRPAVIGKRRGQPVLAQGTVRLRPEAVPHERPRVRMTTRHDAGDRASRVRSAMEANARRASIAAPPAVDRLDVREGRANCHDSERPSARRSVRLP